MHILCYYKIWLIYDIEAQIRIYFPWERDALKSFSLVTKQLMTAVNETSVHMDMRATL